MEIVNLGFKRQVQVAEASEEQENLPVLTGRQIAFMVHTFFKINDVSVGAVSMNDLPNIELSNDKSQTHRSHLGRHLDGTGEGTRGRSFGRAFIVDSWRSRRSCKMPWRCFTLVRFT